MVFKLLGVTFLTLCPSLLTYGHASLEDHSHGGLSEQMQAQISNNRNAALVYWARETETGFQEIPEEFSNITQAQLRRASEALVREKQSVTDWNQNPLKHYVSYAFQHLNSEEFAGFEDIVMSYVRSDFENNPANDALFDTGFFGGNLSLIESYSNYILGAMSKELSFKKLDKEDVVYAEMMAEVIKILSKQNTPSSRLLAKEISSRVAGNFVKNDQDKVLTALLSLLESQPSKPVIKQPNTPLVEKTKGPPLEPATQESAEVATSEPFEEPADKSSNWWLWLIGALVVLGGVGFTVRRKS